MTIATRFKNIKVYAGIQKGICIYKIVRDGKPLTIKIKGISISPEQERSLSCVLQMLDQASEFEYYQVLKKLPHTYLV